MTPSLLPPNATALERALEATDALLAQLPMAHAPLKDPWRCPADLLPWLAWELSLDSWNSAWPEHIKRQRIARALTIQRHKGTAGSVRAVIESFGGAVVITEWWQQQPRGMPHTFQLQLVLSGQPGVEASAQYVEEVIAEVNRTKPVRSHFTFTQGANFAGQLGLIGALRPALFVRLSLIDESELCV